MLNLSPSAKAVLDAFCESENGVYLEGDPERLAAALRVAASEVYYKWRYGMLFMNDLNQLADELEGLTNE